jgi:Zn-dependent peptidase ImmA (M78 family)
VEKKQFVTVMGVAFEVKFKEKLTEDGDECYGLTDGAARTIEISTALNKTEDMKASTLVHEYCHAVLYVTGQSETLTTEQEEGLVIAFEHALVQSGFVLELEEDEE